MLRPVPARARLEPACFSLENLCENPAIAEVNFQTTILSRYPRECLYKF
jgi:hypothetical protein